MHCIEMIKLIHYGILLYYTILLNFESVNSARILGIYPFPGTSHYRLGSSLFQELFHRGHNITVISTFGEKELAKHDRYRDILVNDLFDKSPKKGKEWNMFKREGLNPFVGAYFVATMGSDYIAQVLNHSKIQALLHSEEHFDAVIVDNFLSDAFKAFATHFNAPLIVLNPIWSNFWINPTVGNPSPPSYVPNVLSNYYHPMTFCERLSNTLLDVFNYFLYHYVVYPNHNTLVEKYIPRGGNLNTILYNVSLVLLNSHSSLNQPVPTVPNMIEVGGLHMKPPKSLPQDLQEFLDGADEGVIYFSMGSNLQSVHFPPEKMQAFIAAFSKLQQKVLWKWENNELPEKPDNVKIHKWLPQPDLLAHPNIRLFITHGGFVSSIEAAYHGVPVLVIPIYGDQMQNARFAVKNQFGEFIIYNQISENALLEKIHEILENPKYKENAVKRSQIYHDRLVDPMDEAIYWVEYVIKHRGAVHLQVAGKDMSLFSYYLLDVLIFLILFCASITIIFGIIVKKLCTKLKPKLKRE